MDKGCEKILKGLQPLLDHLGVEPDHIEKLQVEPEGPRILIEATPPWAKKIYLDISPDGAELTITIEAPGDLDPTEAEALLEDAVEEADWATGIEEYDVSYTPNPPEATILLHAKLLQHLPRGPQAAQLAKQALQE